MQRRRAFTLVELLIVIIIIGILFAITAGIYGAAETRARDQQRLSNLDTINNAIEQYHLDNRNYPLDGVTTNNIFVAKYQLESIENCGDSGVGHVAPYYIPTIPEDPQYRLAASGAPCNTNQFGQYLYVPNVPSSGNASTPVQSFYLMARMEKISNMSPSGTAVSLQGSFGTSFWGPRLYTNVVFCDAGTVQQTTCTQNYFRANTPN